MTRAAAFRSSSSARRRRAQYAEEGEPRARVCFQYMFNMAKNLKPGSAPPCGLRWDEVDVLLGLFPTDAMVQEYLPRTGAPPLAQLPHLTIVSILEIYQAMLETQLGEAYAAAGFTPLTHDDLLAVPQKCDVRDVHFALPGLTDHAVQVWFSLIATGLVDHPGQLVGPGKPPPPNPNKRKPPTPRSRPPRTRRRRPRVL